MTKKTAFRIGVLLIGCAAVVAAIACWPLKDALSKFAGTSRWHLADFFVWVRDLGWWGPALLAAVYVPACLLFVPGSILTIGAGYAFGPVIGTVAASIGSVAGASAAFWAGRTVARGWVERKVSRSPRFRALDQAVHAQGFTIVLLTRLSPLLPFNLLNYAFGLTCVRFRDYFLASWLGMLPGAVMYAYLGSAIKEVADVVAGRVDAGTPGKVFFVLGLAATMAVVIVVTRAANRALARALPSAVSRDGLKA
jgi:uncharacterized membrane protein YdjX (TVP38/TMEM64 family)